MKQEPIDTDSEMETENSVDTESIASSSAGTVKNKPIKKTTQTEKQTGNTTSESLYEDAVCEQPKKLQLQNAMELPLSQQSDATFVSSTDQSENDQLEPRATYVVPISNCTVTSATIARAVVSPIHDNASNATFFVDGAITAPCEPAKDQTVVIAVNRKGSATSIMTEDDSDSSSASPVRNYIKAAEQILNGGTKKNPKELFK